MLQAEGVAVQVVRGETLFTVVPPTDVIRAAASLAAWQSERAVAPPAPEPPSTFAAATKPEILLAAASAFCLVAFYMGLEHWGAWANSSPAARTRRCWCSGARRTAP